MGEVMPFPGTVSAAPDPSALVCVPGQRFWHTHTCPVCHSSWTHIAPRPMSVALNEKIHTCTKCGTRVWTFVKLEDSALSVPVWWIGAAVIGGALLQRLLDGR